MSGSSASINCGCGRPLVADETQCPSCQQEHVSFWKTVGATVFSVAGVIVWVAASVLTGGRVPPPKA